MASIEPYNFREKTNLQEHNDIINKVNEIVDVINDTDLDNIGTRLTNDESQIAVNTANIKANTTSISELRTTCSELDNIVDTIEPMVDNHETDIANLKESERRLSNDVVSTYTLYRNGEGKIKAQMETVGGTLIDSNTLDMIIPYQYDIISGTTDRSFKLNITMSDGSSYTTNDFIIPEGGGSEIVVTGITLSKDSSNVNRFHVGINLSDSTMIDSGYITMVDNVSASFVDSKLTISVNGVSSVPVAIDVSGEFTAGTGITITSGTIAIDDTVVALKSDIADMLTKTDADAEYATKTALASTDANVALAQSTADDANNKANSAIDNVSISGSTMTFTKINDEHIDLNITSSIDFIDMRSIKVTYNATSSTKSTQVICPQFYSTGYYYGKFFAYINACWNTEGMPEKSYYSFSIPNSYLVTLATLVDNSLNLKDGDSYIVALASFPSWFVVTKSEGEIISVNSGNPLTIYWYSNANPIIRFGGLSGSTITD